MADLDQTLLDPYAAQVQAIQNRQRLAQMMVQNGMDGAPVYSPAAGIAKALTIALGQYDMGRGDKALLDLANKRQGDRQAEMTRLLALSQPQAADASQFPQKDDNGNPVPGGAGGPPVSQGAPNPRFALAKELVMSNDPTISSAGLGMLLRGPDAPIVKEAGGKLFVLSPDGRTVLNTVGSQQVAPPSIADATPESLAVFQRTGNAGDLVPRVKQVPVDTGSGVQFVNPENPGGPITKSMSPDAAAADLRERASLADKGVRLPPPSASGPGMTFPSAPPTGGSPQTVVSPGVQQQRDAGRMNILLQERQQQIAQTGKSDPALEVEIADMQRRGFGGASNAPSTPGLSPADQRAVAAQTAQGMAKGATDYKTALDDRVRAGSDLMLRLNEAHNALQNFKTGMGSENRLNVARAASAIGMPNNIVNGIAGGDVASMQEFQKLAAQQAMESLKQAMGGTGRITQAEFKVFQQNNPNIELQPDAIQKIFDFSRRVFTRDTSEQSAMGDYLKGGGDISQWPTAWTQQQLKAGLMNPQSQQPQSGVVRVSSDQDYAALPSGAQYVAPDGKTRVKR